MSDAPAIADTPPETPAPAASAAPSLELPPALATTLHALARRDLVLAWLRGAALLALLFPSAALVRGLLDYWLQLDWPVRAAFLAVDLALAAWIVRRHVWQPWKRRLTPATAALRLQRAFPVLGSHLIAAVQLPAQARAGRASPALTALALAQASARLEPLPWREAAPARPAVRLLVPALAVALLAVAVGIHFSPTSGLLLRRAWLSTEPPFTRTRLAVLPGDTDLALGAPVTLLARTAGLVPPDALFEVRSGEGDIRAFTATPAPDAPGDFPLVIDNVQQSFRYRVSAGDARSPWHEVAVLLPPVLESISVTIEPPAYTGLPAVAATGDTLDVPAGSTLRLSGRAAAPLLSAAVDLWDNPRDENAAATLPLPVAEAAFTGVIPPDQLPGAFSVRLSSREGLSSQNDTRYRLRFIADNPPVLELPSTPADGDLALPTQGLRVLGRVADDYGLKSLALRWEITRDAATTPGSRPLELSGSPRQAAFETTLPLDQAAAGATFTWWIEAVDHANTAVSPKRALRIVTPEEKVSATLEQVRDRSAVLDELGRAQDALSETLGRTLESQKP